MVKRSFAYIQYILPQHLLSKLIGRIAESSNLRLKNLLITRFIQLYKVDMHDAALENPNDYPTFNSFFIRKLKTTIRPFAQGEQNVASPADGTVAQIGHINQNQLLQAKDFYFNLETLLAKNLELAKKFYGGSFATIYLAPHNYHRVHMPIAGKLEKTIYVPGKLFSVNTMTAELIPHLYSRNERLVCIFDTAIGKMAVILVGAMIVGSMQTAWMDQPIKHHQVVTKDFNEELFFNKGDELGYFKMGSTVILLFEKDKINWLETLTAGSSIICGQMLGETS